VTIVFFAPLLWRYQVDENALSRIVVECAISVHRTLGGPGLLEHVYEEALAWELNHRGLHVDRQYSVPIVYKGQQLGTPLRLDMLVENLVIIEVKATAEYNSIFESQTLTYLRLTNLRLGMVVNFGERYVREGIHRVVNGL
jgi:GxxExxY protein